MTKGRQNLIHRIGALAAGMDRHALLVEVKRVCDGHLAAGSTAILALSGGPDSTAMAHLVSEARPDLQLFAAHVRHGLRDDEADARVAAGHAAALEMGYLERAVTVHVRGIGVEAAARLARYDALAQMARQVSAAAVLVGHSADDQAETVLLNIVRGSGLPGLSGMAVARDLAGFVVIRPLLRLRRSDIRDYITGEGLAAVDDPTNQDPGQRRARARMRAMPALASLSGGPGDPVAALTRLADLARADASALEEVAREYAQRLTWRWGPARCLRYADLGGLAPALASRVIRGVVQAVSQGGEGPDADTVARLLELRPGEAVNIAGGVWATAGGGWLGLVPADAEPITPREVVVPGRTPVPEAGIALASDMPWTPPRVAAGGQLAMPIDEVPILSAARAQAPEPLGALPPGARGTAAGAWVVLPEHLIAGLVVRSRVPGDRLRLAHGTRKLQDLYTDQGVPRAIRDLVPIIVDAHGDPLWVPGVAERALDLRSGAAARIWLLPPPTSTVQIAAL